MGEVGEYRDYHKAPFNDGNWQRDYVSNTFDETLEFGGGYSVNLLDFLLNGIEPYKNCREDIQYAYDYDNGYSKRIINRIVSTLQLDMFKDVVPSVTIYRTVPNHVVGEDDIIHDGDWITLSPIYAREHGELRYTDDYHILSMRVPINHIYWDGQHLCEFGYDSRVFEWNEPSFLNKRKDKSVDVLVADATVRSEKSNNSNAVKNDIVKE